MDKPWLKFYDSGIPAEINFPPITLPDLLDQAVERNSRGIAISFFGRKTTYAKLQHQVNQIAIALTRLGVKKGDRVALMLPNIPQYPVLHFAVLKIGAILVPTNPLYVERELQYQLNNSGARTVVTLDVHYPKIQRVKAETGIENIIVTSVKDYLPPVLRILYPLRARKDGKRNKIRRAPGVHFFEDLLAEDFVMELPDVTVTPADIALLMYTGGTTGLSKGAILTHGNLVANVMQIRTWYGDVKENEEKVLSALPFFHSYGLTTCLHMAVLLRSTMVLIPDPRDLKTLLRTVEKEKTTLFSGVPTLFIAINNFPEISKRYDVSSIKACVSGGAPLPLEVAKEFEANTGGALVEGYGLSEASPVTHVNSISGKRKEGSIGMPLPNTDAKIVDPQTKKELPVGEIGELAVRGPQV
ncbi:MAG: AMP-binding protein, partial [bacterium]